MQASPEIRQKMSFLIGNLICRCIQDARIIPYIIGQEEMINILVDDPFRFQNLVQEEHSTKTEYSKKDLTLKLDAIEELAKFEDLDNVKAPLWNGIESDIAPILDLTNQLTRTFAVYIGNASTLFDKNLEEFMGKFRQTLRKAGMDIKAIDFGMEDVAVLEEKAEAYLMEGEFLQAFTYDRLLSSQVMIKQLVNLPVTGVLLKESLIRKGLQEARLIIPLIKFVLRASYISHGVWGDLFPILATIAQNEPALCNCAQLVELIEKDAVFSCNLLCRSYAELSRWPAAQRRAAIDGSLQKYRGNKSKTTTA
jgi:hypothetical protein